MTNAREGTTSQGKKKQDKPRQHKKAKTEQDSGTRQNMTKPDDKGKRRQHKVSKSKTNQDNTRKPRLNRTMEQDKTR